MIPPPADKVLHASLVFLMLEGGWHLTRSGVALALVFSFVVGKEIADAVWYSASWLDCLPDLVADACGALIWALTAPWGRVGRRAADEEGFD